MIRLGIIGAAGRMGRRIAALAIESQQFDIVCGTELPGHDALGQDIGRLAGVGDFGVAVGEKLTGQPQVVIDFSLPEGTMQHLPACRNAGVAMVIGTTGLTASQEAEIADTASMLPIVRAGNFSMGINVLLNAVRTVARALGGEYDIEISETHHRFKKDAPSGTALMLGRAAAEGRNVQLPDVARYGREGHCPRQPGEIGISALRLGDTVGEHSVHFGSLGETVTLSHSAHTRDIFVRGALRAAGWLPGRQPGLYDMQDVLGLKEPRS